MSSVATLFLSPLRYPGGKGRIAPFVAQLLEAQPRRPSIYVEPFAGGAGVALRLLHDEYVDEVVLNDLDAGIAAFWRSVFDQPIELIELLRSCSPSLDEWHRQRTLYVEKAAGDLELGFATLFLNRTNRSGILTARPIGGLEQTGKWSLAARWNPEQLEDRIRRSARYSTRVTICEDDGIAVTTRYLRDSETFVYADPPYIARADGLYLDTLGPDDHQRLAATLRGADRWLLTYDTHPEVLHLYQGLRFAVFGIKHTAAIQHIGSEYAVFPDSLVVPSLDRLGRGDARFLGARTCTNHTSPSATSG